MTSIDIDTLFAILFVKIDDWYLMKGQRFLATKAGRKPKFSDSEVLTLMLGAEYLPFSSENRYLGYMRANRSDLFPDLLSQSQFNRRAQLALLNGMSAPRLADRLGHCASRKISDRYQTGPSLEL